MSYKIVATKEDQTMRSVRQSLLIAAAKARVLASEGWDVVVTDGEERTLDPADFEKLFEVKQVLRGPVARLFWVKWRRPLEPPPSRESMMGRLYLLEGDILWKRTFSRCADIAVALLDAPVLLALQTHRPDE